MTNFSAAFCAALFLPTLVFAAEKFEPSRFNCMINQVSVHNIGDGSFQRSVPPGTKNFLRIRSATKVDRDIWCNTEITTAFQRGYCTLPYSASMGDTVLLGDNQKVFRGFFPYDYLVLFDDSSFIQSSGLSDGVVVESGRCTLD